MRMRRLYWIAALIAPAAGGAYWASTPPATIPAPAAPLATPPGITLRPLAADRSLRGTGAAALAFADVDGAPLYRFDKGAEPGGPVCASACAQPWRPATAPSTLAATGDWSVVSTAGGRQWEFEGAPLFVRRADAPNSDGESDGENGASWQSVTFQPDVARGLPAGIAVRDLPNGGGQAFTDDVGMTLYEADSPIRTGPAEHWKAAGAPEAGRGIGDFSVVARDDGIRQWAHLGRPLYRFDGDVEPGDANGGGIDRRFRVALLRRYFMPDDVAIRHAPALGDILTTRAGMTLYARDRFIDADGHNFRTDHGAWATGRALGVSACDEDCAKTWRPFTAPAAALPSGHWDIVVRPDGARQWAYKGYALYTFAGDRQPGDVNGNESYTLMPLGGSDPHGAASIPGIGVGALFWRAATP